MEGSLGAFSEMEIPRYLFINIGTIQILNTIILSTIK